MRHGVENCAIDIWGGEEGEKEEKKEVERERRMRRRVTKGG